MKCLFSPAVLEEQEIAMATLAVRDMGATVAQHTPSQTSRDGQTAPSRGTGAFHGLGNYWEFVSSSVGSATKKLCVIKGIDVQGRLREGLDDFSPRAALVSFRRE